MNGKDSGPARRRFQARWLWAAIVVTLLGFAGAAVRSVYVPRDRKGEGVELEVEPGMSLTQVAGRLSEAGIIRSRTVFLLAGRRSGMDTRIKAGRYEVSPAQSTAEILRLLRRGSVSLTRLMIPEGLTAAETAAAIAGQTGLAPGRFLAYVDSLDASSLLGFPADGMEGFLFPNTYMVSEDVRPGEIVRLMVKAFRSAVGDSFPEQARAASLSPYEAVTLASIIEKEAHVPGERPRISAVFHNRLKRGWRLEADPTVRYALDKWNGPLTYKDLEVESPFNTYVVRGLPPGPIANPGWASIEAALHPEPGVEDLYFVAAGDGSHRFSRTLEAHLQATDAVRRKRR